MLGVGALNADTREIDVQLLGGDLRDRGQNALADLDMGDFEYHLTVGVEANEGVDAHGAISWAARCMARIMRLWVPQRQICTSRARQISSRVGSGLSSSKALAAMINPALQ